MTTITLEDIGRDPLGYLRRVEAGEEFLVVDEARPVAEIKPAAAPSGSRRPFGLCAGQFTVPDDFDDPLPEAVLREFEGT